MSNFINIYYIYNFLPNYINICTQGLGMICTDSLNNTDTFTCMLYFKFDMLPIIIVLSGKYYHQEIYAIEEVILNKYVYKYYDNCFKENKAIHYSLDNKNECSCINIKECGGSKFWF